MTTFQRWILFPCSLLLLTAFAPQAQQASTLAAPTGYQVIIRVPPPPATVTIQLPSLSPTYDAGIASSIPVSGIATTLTSVTGCTWTNSLGGSGVATGTPNYNWSIASVPLAFGSNVITIFCADVYLQTGIGVITITRTLPPIPVVTITGPTSSPTFDAGTASTQTVSGTASTAATITGCTWVNSLGGSGSASGTTSWSIASLPLTIGVNTVTVTCSDQFSQTGNDVIAITRSAGGSVSNPISGLRQPGGSTAVPNAVWALAGVRGGIPSSGWSACVTAACNTLAGSTWPTCTGCSVTQTTINNALTSADGSSTVVRIPAGTYSVGGITFAVSKVALRGAGSDSTKLTFTSTASGQCNWVQNGAIKMCTNTGNIACTSSCSGSGPDNSATWNTATLSQGTTTITISSAANLVARSGTTPGTTIYLDQTDDSSDSGNVLMCDSGGVAFCSWEGNGGNPHRTGRSQVEPHEVVSFSGSAPNVSVVIDPPVIAPNFIAGKSPGAWWGSTGNHVKLSGVENLTIDFSSVGSNSSAVYMVNTTNTWVSGVRTIWTGSQVGFLLPLYFTNTFRVSVVNNYLYGPTVTAGANTNYAVSTLVSGQNLYQNNILHHFATGFAQDDAEVGSVYAYNYSDDEQYTPSAQPHGSGVMFTLWEGNNFDSIWHDVIHGPHVFETEFRNHIDRTAHNQGSVAENGGILIYAKNRYFNLVANVIGHASLTSYQQTTMVDNAVYLLNFAGSHMGSGPGTDSNVTRTLFRACNWDSVTSTNDNGTNDATGTRNVAGEAPSALADYPQPALADCTTLPPSLYLAAKPAFMGALAWPLIGPDVASSTVATSTGGHANKNPARVCFEVAPNDAAYPSSSPRIKAGVASACAVP